MKHASTVKVWDSLVRLFHWSLLLFFIAAYASGEEWLALHVQAGYVIAGLIVFRVVWGVIGPRHARFADFVHSPRAVVTYLKDLVTSHPPRYLGHNPAGGAMVIALLTSLAVTTVSGVALYVSAEFAGPLAWLLPHGAGWGEVLEELHEVAANLTVLLVALHVTGVIVSSVVHRESLVRAMITGRKPTEAS